MKTAMKWKCHPFSALTLFLELLTWAWYRIQGDPRSSPACSYDLRSGLVLRGEGAQVWGLQDHKKHKNCRNVSSLAFLLEFRLTGVARACAERGGLMGWPHRNLLLREKREIQTPVRDNTPLRNCLICVGHTWTAAENIRLLRTVESVGFVCLFFSSSMSLISIQIGTRPFLDSAGVRGEVLLLFVR